MNRKLRIFDTTWHVMHCSDMCTALKDVADFYLCYNHAKEWKRAEFLAARPIPDNVHFVCGYEPNVYDFAILHVDQQIVNPDLGKTKVFKDLLEVTKDIPRVVINHGSPVYPEYIQEVGMTAKQSQMECIRTMKELIGDIPMIVNSKSAASENEWGWGYPIIHGMDKDMWLDLPKEPRVFSALSPAGCDEYYNRMTMNEVVRLLHDHHSIELLWAKVNVKTEDNLEVYKQYLGRSLLYLDVSYRTPMNRGRTEAMLSGCCVVQVEGCHDKEMFTDKENILFVRNNPKEIADFISDLLENRYDECLEIGKNAKKFAQEFTSYDRYREDWLRFIKEVLNITL